MSPVDDPTIGDDEALWRRIAPSQIRVDENGQEEPISGAFNGTEISVHIASLTTRQAVQARYAHHRIVALTAGDARAAGYAVKRDPQEDDQSHALIIAREELTKNPALARARLLRNCARWI